MADPDKDDDKKPKEDATRASLVTASGSDDPKKAARAKAALAAYDEGEDEKAEDEKEKPSASASPAAAVPDDDEKKALKATVSALSASVQAMQEEQASARALSAAAERSAFLATRPDLSAELLATIGKLPLAQAKEIVNAIPVPRGSISNPLAARPAAAVQGSKEAEYRGGSAEQQAYLDAKMGITEYAPRAVVDDGYVQRFGVRSVKAL